MSGAVEGARTSISPQAFNDLPEYVQSYIRHLESTTPPARSYADGVEDAAKVADDYEQHTGDPAFDAATDVAAVTIGERIRLLSQGEKA